MQSRRNEQRRRRVVLDEAKSSASSSQADESESPQLHADQAPVRDANGRSYTTAAKRRNQPRTTDLFPKRTWKLLLVICGIIATVAGLIVASRNAPTWTTVLGEQATDVFAISGTGSLSAWFSSFMFVLTGLASLQILALRQHRCDDYRGKYRLWIWMSMIFLLASVNCVVDVAGIAKTAVANLWPTVSLSFWVLLSIKSVALLLLIARGAFEIRHSKMAVLSLVVVLLAYAGGMALQVEPIRDHVAGTVAVQTGSFWLVGNTFVFITVLAFTRYVYLDAHGLIAVRAERVKKPKKKKVAKKKPRASAAKKSPVTATRKKATRTTDDKDETEPRSTRKTSKSTKKPVAVPKSRSRSATSDLETDDFDDEYQELSKAERRRARKQQRRQRRAA